MRIVIADSCRWVTVITVLLLCGAVVQGQVGLDPAVYSTDAAGRLISLRGALAPQFPLAPPGDWTAPELLGSYPAFDNWNLDTAGARDSQGNIEFSIRLWEYNDQNWNYDRYVLDPAGDPVGTWPNTPGLGDAAVFTDGAGHNVALRPVATTQNFAVTDSMDYVHVFSTRADGGWEVAYSKVDPLGNTVIPMTILTDGADMWNWYVQPVVLSDDTLVVTWLRSTEDICAISSSDHGVTWSDITVLLDRTSTVQASCVKTVVGSDDSLHFVWRTLDWSTYVEGLWYAKLRPDWSIAVDQTQFFQGACWYPYASLDDAGRLHITFTPQYDVSTTAYYTRLRGDLDLGGAPATDETLTLVPEQVFLTDTVPLHYPANVPDASGAVHVLYDRGLYGRGTDKDAFYVCLRPRFGDLNCDGALNTFDIDPFVLALSDPNGYEAAYPECDRMLADCNGDSAVNTFDIDPFVALLLGG